MFYSHTYATNSHLVVRELDHLVVEYLKKEFLPEDPLISLDFKERFFDLGNFDTNKATVYFNLIHFGATQINANVFRFDNWNTLFTARAGMANQIPWAFYFLFVVITMSIGQL